MDNSFLLFGQDEESFSIPPPPFPSTHIDSTHTPADFKPRVSFCCSQGKQQHLRHLDDVALLRQRGACLLKVKYMWLSTVKNWLLFLCSWFTRLFLSARWTGSDRGHQWSFLSALSCVKPYRVRCACFAVSLTVGSVHTSRGDWHQMCQSAVFEWIHFLS